jgi:hypothetical protein
MAQRRHTKSNPQVYTAPTGDPIYDPEDPDVSDAGNLTAFAGTAGPTVGRTAFDVIHEQGIAAALAKVIRKFDPVEVLATTAYVLFGLFMKSGGLVMRFWVFCALLAGYHWLVRPLGGYLEKVLDAKADRGQPDRHSGERPA